MKNVFIFLLVFGLYFFQFDIGYAKTVKLKKDPPAKTILKKDDSGLVVLSLYSNMHNYKIFLLKYDPKTGQVINEGKVYRLKGPQNLIKGRNLKTELDHRDFVFLMEPGTYFFSSVQQKYNTTTNYLCVYNSMMFDVSAEETNFLGDFFLDFNAAPPSAVQMRKIPAGAEKAKILIQQQYPDLDYAFRTSNVEELSLPTECNSSRRTTRVIVYP